MRTNVRYTRKTHHIAETEFTQQLAYQRNGVRSTVETEFGYNFPIHGGVPTVTPPSPPFSVSPPSLLFFSHFTPIHSYFTSMYLLLCSYTLLCLSSFSILLCFLLPSYSYLFLSYSLLFCFYVSPKSLLSVLRLLRLFVSTSHSTSASSSATKSASPFGLLLPFLETTWYQYSLYSTLYYHFPILLSLCPFPINTRGLYHVHNLPLPHFNRLHSYLDSGRSPQSICSSPRIVLALVLDHGHSPQVHVLAQISLRSAVDIQSQLALVFAQE
jgi:hypothetical protein